MPGERDDFRVDNKISGGNFEGPVVLARRVEMHVNSPRPEEQSAEARSARRRRALGLSLLGVGVWAATSLYAGDASLSPGSRQVLALSGPVLLIAGAVWWAAVWVRERRGPRRAPDSDQLARIAGNLATALADEYARDEKQLHVHDPAPIPVRWSAASPLLSDHEPNIRRTPVTSRAPDAEPLDLTGDFDAIGPFFATVPSRRLVVLGAPGAGKSALVLHLARALLSQRAADDPVPVLLPIASWNPTEEDLWHWAARRLSAQHPAALRTPQLAHDLITTGRILPILDGLDELPESTRPKALTRLRRSLNDPARLVLTCRIEEYEAAVAEAQTVLPAAAVVQLEPLGVEDLKAYLPRTAVRIDATATKWTPVLDRLADPEDRAPEVATLRTVLGTPLMVSLARSVYSETRADPKELLEDERFREPRVVERHLFDAFLSAVYEDSGERARKWAGYLAAELRRTGEQDIAWWRLGDVVPWPVRWLGTGLSVVVAAIAVGMTSYDHPPWREYFPVPPWVAVLLVGSAAALFDWGVAPPGYLPQRLNWPRREELRTAWTTFRGLLVGMVSGLAILVPVDLLWDDFESFWGFPSLITAGAILSFLLTELSRPADPSDAREPAALLRSDRRTELALCAFAPLRPARRRWATEAVLTCSFAVVLEWQYSVEHHMTNGLTWIRTLGLILLAWALCRWSVSAAGRLTMARLHFLRTGALPWSVMTFLGEAHRLGLLRQSGGLYRFRHIELRNRLAEAYGVTEDGESRPQPVQRETTLDTVGGDVFGGILLLGLSLAVLLFLALPDLSYPYRTPASACALVSPAQVRAAIVEPVRDTGSTSSCAYYERSPFRPARTLSVAAEAMFSRWGLSGVEDAREYMRWEGRSPQPGIGDEWAVTVAKSGPHGAMEGEVRVRVGNMVVTVEYAEEYATADRVSEVARILAEGALRRTGLPPEKIHAEGGTLADVPEPSVPEKTRISGYRRPERAVHGDVWSDEDRSDIQTFDGISFPLRTLRDMACGDTKKVQTLPEYTVRCQGYALQLDVAEHVCPDEGCTPSQTREFQQRRPGWKVTSWRDAPADGVRYAVRRDEDGWCEMSLFARYTPEGERPRLVWVRASAGPGPGPEPAQKIVNSAYTQVSAP